MRRRHLSQPPRLEAEKLKVEVAASYDCQFSWLLHRFSALDILYHNIMATQWVLSHHTFFQSPCGVSFVTFHHHEDDARQ